MTLESPLPLTLEGEPFLADASGALYWPREECLVVADLHFEKGSSYARRRIFLPPYDTRATLAALERALERFRPKRVIALGDSFHDRDGAGRLSVEERGTLAEMMRGREWIWVLGNHDPAPPGIGGTAVNELAVGTIVLRHEPRHGEAPGEIAGHLHPSATVRGLGGSVRRRCFALDARRLVLPAFGAYTGGLSVFDEAFARVLSRPFDAIVLGRHRPYRVPHKRLG